MQGQQNQQTRASIGCVLDFYIMSNTEETNPFANLDSLKVDQSFDDITTETVYTHISLRQPSPQDFFRVNPAED